MAETEKEIDNGIDRIEKHEGEEENITSCHSQISNTSLVELNMLLVILSSANSSSVDNLHEENDHIIRDRADVNKTYISRLEAKKKEKHEPRLIGKKAFSSRFQTTIKDSRHGRKM
ncbi:uncharacterized protein LOC131612918 [Vicia villosa]|uniref:uncharacterized protein LOC131612918 n=1 Tax=Vicia villosa TaxID=3911 RepID=UPI00273AFFE5|nr:uncharacterized protein LOC131612918 [Vicia villosa]